MGSRCFRMAAPLTPMPTDETKQVDLASIYALTKYMQERSCQIFGGAYGVEVVALRLFNVFGPARRCQIRILVCWRISARAC